MICIVGNIGCMCSYVGFILCCIILSALVEMLVAMVAIVHALGAIVDALVAVPVLFNPS